MGDRLKIMLQWPASEKIKGWTQGPPSFFFFLSPAALLPLQFPKAWIALFCFVQFYYPIKLISLQMVALQWAKSLTVRKTIGIIPAPHPHSHSPQAPSSI